MQSRTFSDILGSSFLDFVQTYNAELAKQLNLLPELVEVQTPTPTQISVLTKKLENVTAILGVNANETKNLLEKTYELEQKVNALQSQNVNLQAELKVQTQSAKRLEKEKEELKIEISKLVAESKEKLSEECGTATKRIIAEETKSASDQTTLVKNELKKLQEESNFQISKLNQ